MRAPTRDELRALLEGVRRLGFSGVNVTFPYKEAVVPLLDALAPGAAAIGAVNTVVVRDGRLTGHNTDTTGFARGRRRRARAPAACAVALIGAGGVGKAIAFALAEPRRRRHSASSTRERAKAEALGDAAAGRRRNARVADSVEEALQGAGGVINGTPIGMLPNRDSPVPDGAAARRPVGRRRRLHAALDAAAASRARPRARAS